MLGRLWNWLAGPSAEGSPPSPETEDLAEHFVFQSMIGTDGNVDVIFIHGLTGDAIATWTSPESKEKEGGFWPKWMHADIPGLNIYTLGYPASLFAKWAKKEMNLYERAKATLERLAGKELGARPIVLITHSLGGLLAKQIIRTGLESPDPAFRRIAKNIRLVVFLATPHTGSSLASILTFITPRLVSGHVDLLQSGGDQLDELKNAYRTSTVHERIKTAVYYEKFKTLNAALVVRREDADPGISGIEIIPVDADHLTICKPRSRDDDVYLGVCRRIREMLAELAKGPAADAPAAVPDQDAENIDHLKDWLRGGDGSGDIATKASLARKNALAGQWEGTQRQPNSSSGEAIQYQVFCDIGWEGNAVTGNFRYRYQKDGLVLADETMPFRGTFTHDRFVKLNYEDTVSGKLQFGSLLLELGDDGQTLQGVDVGFGYNTKKIMAAENILHKQKT